MILTLKNEGHRIVAIAQQVFCKIQPGAGKPLRTRHFPVVVDHLVITFRCLDLDKIPDGGPESGELVYRPGIEIVIIGEIMLVSFVDEGHEAVHVAAFDTLFRRLPQQLSHLDPSSMNLLMMMEISHRNERFNQMAAEGI